MKTKINLPVLLAFVLALSVLPFQSCRKKEEKIETEENVDDEQESASDNNTAENLMTEIEAMGSELTENKVLISFRTGQESGISGEYGVNAAPCATVYGLSTSIYTVDFGTSGCTGADGRVRTGKLIFDFSASSPSTAIYYRNPGFAMNVSSQNYVVDGYTVNIVNKNVSNTTPASISPSVNPGINLTWAITASVNIVKPGSAGTISWNCSRTKELLNTADTNCYHGQNRPINWQKAIVKINGTSSGVNAKQENYTAVATDLVRDWSCSPDPQRPKRHPFISGTLSYTPGIRLTRLINYGSGNCDLSATLSIGNKTFNINI